MRITFPCSDIKGYLEDPNSFLPENVVCIRNETHRTQKHGHWVRELVIDHAMTTSVKLYRWYCRECGESISFWPEFVLPYQPEPVDTHEDSLVQHLSGKSYTEVADQIGYDKRAVARWVQRLIGQALLIAPRLIPEIMKAIASALLPQGVGGTLSIVTQLLAWLHQYAQIIEDSLSSRLLGLANRLRRGRLIIWGGEVGRCQYGREWMALLPGLPPPGGR